MMMCQLAWVHFFFCRMALVLLLHCSCNCILLLLGILVEIVHDSRGVTTDLSTVQTEAGLQPPNKNPTRPSDSLVLVKHVLQQLLLPLSSDKDAASHCRLVGTPYYYHGTAVQIQLGGRPRGTRQLMAATVPLFSPAAPRRTEEETSGEEEEEAGKQSRAQKLRLSFLL